MKFSQKHYTIVEESIRAYDRAKLMQYKSQLAQKVESKEMAVNSFEVRFIFDVYYACVPLPVRLQISDEGNYTDAHIQTALKKALKRSGVV